MRVRLEPQTEEHADGLFAALQAEEIYAFLGSAPPVSVEEVRQRIARQNRGPQDGSGARWLNWIIIVDDAVAGYTQATIAADGTTNLAYVLSPSFWGRSIGYEACRQTLLALGGIDGVKRLIADTERGNMSSGALLRRLGFQLSAETEQDAFYDGGDIQTLVSALK